MKIWLIKRSCRDDRAIIRNKSGKVNKLPDFSSRKFSDKQLSHQQRFQETAAYTRKAAKEQPLHAELAADTMKTAYTIARSNWFHPPAIKRIERQGDTLRVLAGQRARGARVGYGSGWR